MIHLPGSALGHRWEQSLLVWEPCKIFCTIKRHFTVACFFGGGSLTNTRYRFLHTRSSVRDAVIVDYFLSPMPFSDAFLRCLSPMPSFRSIVHKRGRIRRKRLVQSIT